MRSHSTKKMSDSERKELVRYTIGENKKVTEIIKLMKLNKQTVLLFLQQLGISRNLGNGQGMTKWICLKEYKDDTNSCPRCKSYNAITWISYDKRWSCLFCGWTSYTKQGLKEMRVMTK